MRSKVLKLLPFEHEGRMHETLVPVLPDAAQRKSWGGRPQPRY